VIDVKAGELTVVAQPDRRALGAAAAEYVATRIRDGLAERPRLRLIFAAAASQTEFLAALVEAEGVDWSRIDAFHLDEYIGLPPGHPSAFGRWLDEHIFALVHPGRVEKLNGEAPDPDAECVRYGRLVEDGGIDLALIGVGENGHLAFNDPHVADFDDPLAVKVVEIDETSRRQQVRDGAFASVDQVPTLAMTVTMSTILASRAISIVVAGPQKAAAVHAMLEGPISTACPASALRRHPDAVLFTDYDALARTTRSH
jgi:glucosamine-6-phosphate deaminase